MVNADMDLHWSDDFLLGYPPMDEVHHEFVDIVGAMLRCPDEELLGHLRAFVAHAVSHFDQEAAWMDATDFPAADCHKSEHAKVLASAREVEALVAGGNTTIGRLLAEELAKWFPAHADYLDSALAQWLARRRLGGVPVVLRRTTAGRPLDGDAKPDSDPR